MPLIIILVFIFLLALLFFRFIFDLALTIVSGVFKIIAAFFRALGGGFRR